MHKFSHYVRYNSSSLFIADLELFVFWRSLGGELDGAHKKCMERKETNLSRHEGIYYLPDFYSDALWVFLFYLCFWPCPSSVPSHSILSNPRIGSLRGINITKYCPFVLYSQLFDSHDWTLKELNNFFVHLTTGKVMGIKPLVV